MQIELVDARTAAETQDWLRSVHSFYLHDLSEYVPKAYRLDASGRWDPDYSSYWLTRDYCHPLLIESADVRIGFALVGVLPFPFMTGPSDYRISDFFILRAHRRSGQGRAAALALLRRYHGEGELTVLPDHPHAGTFWRSVLAEGASGVAEDPTHSLGIRVTFRT